MTLSVVVPIYNAEKFIKDCLDSIFSQTFKEFELICINDGSTDDTLEILNRYAGVHKNMVVIDQENGGIGAAINVGLSHAKGKYFFQMDHDDEFATDDAFRIMVETAEEYELDILSFNYKTSAKSSMLNQPSNSLMNGKEYLLGGYHPALWNKLLKIEYLKKIGFQVKENLRFVDTESYPRLMIDAKRVMHIDDALYYFKLESNAESVSKTLNNIRSAYAYFETAKTYNTLASKENGALKKKLEKECFKAVIEVVRIISVVDSAEGYAIYEKLFEFNLSWFEKVMMRNENKFFHNTYVRKEKKLAHPWVYIMRKVTKRFI